MKDDPASARATPWQEGVILGVGDQIGKGLACGWLEVRISCPPRVRVSRGGRFKVMKMRFQDRLLNRRVVVAMLLVGVFMGGWLMGRGGGEAPLAPRVQAQESAAVATEGAVNPYAAEGFRPKNATTAMVARVSPAVLSVGAIKRAVVVDPLVDFFNPFVDRRRISTVRQRTPYLGSGFLVDKDGHILTNFHVIEDSEEVFVTLQSGQQVTAEILGVDRFADMALLKVNVLPDELPVPLEWGDSDELQIGESVMAFGNPFGNLIEDPRPSVTQGVVSALHRSFRPDQRAQRVYANMIQTDAAINPGNSGGPLVDETGRVVGINTFIFSNSGGNIGLGFAIPINRARQFFDEIRTHGRVRSLLVDFDVMGVPRTSRIRGVMVRAMSDGGSAERAGLEVGDIIVTVDGRAVSNRDEFLLILASRQVGDQMNLRVWRAGEVIEVPYTIVEAVE
jgi:serine protease Do